MDRRTFCGGLLAAGLTAGVQAAEPKNAAPVPAPLYPKPRETLGKLKQGVIHCTGVAFRPHGAELAYSDGLAVRFRKFADRTDRGEPLAVKPDLGFRLRYTADGKYLCTANGRNGPSLWDATSGKAAGEARIGGRDFFLSADGKRLGTCGHDGVVRLLDIEGFGNEVVLRGHQGEVMCGTFSPDGARAATGGGEDDLIKVWDARLGRELLSLAGHTDSVRWLKFTPDGKELWSVSNDFTVGVWSLEEKRRTAVLRERESLYEGALSPDGKLFASGGFGGSITLWDAASRRRLAPLKTDRLITALDFSPDGKILAASTFGGTVTLWDVE